MRAKNVVFAWIFAALLSAMGVGGWYGCSNDRATEAVLRTNLMTLRAVIRQYHGDRKRYPESLRTLVDAGYLRKVPVDPFTRSETTWRLTYEANPGPGASRGIVDVHSGAPGTTRQGVPLADL